MSQIDHKRAFNRLKHDLEPWRNIIIQLDGLLTWEKNIYPFITFAGISLFYLVIWLVDLTVVTMLSLACLIYVVFDYLYPSLTRIITISGNWTGKHEAKFESIVAHLCDIKIRMSAWYEYMFYNKERKSTVFVIIVGAVLLILAWTGAVINNVLLLYLSTLMIAMYPGVQKKAYMKQLKQKLNSFIGGSVKVPVTGADGIGNFSSRGGPSDHNPNMYDHINKLD